MRMKVHLCFSYKNIFCAACNGVTDPEFTQARFSCESRYDNLYIPTTSN